MIGLLLFGGLFILLLVGVDFVLFHDAPQWQFVRAWYRWRRNRPVYKHGTRWPQEYAIWKSRRPQWPA